MLLLTTAAALTVIENAASDAEDVPSLTEIAMPEKEPTLLDDGVPVSAPVVVLKLAQLGLLMIENVSVLPLGSVVLGVKLYAVPAVSDVAGLPLIVGGDDGGGGVPPAGAETVMENAASEALDIPSVTEITIPE